MCLLAKDAVSLHTRYLPTAVTALQAAANAATARTIPPAQAQREAQIITESMSMPIPSPSPANSDPRQLSRTSQYASNESFARLRHGSDQFNHPRSVSNPGPSGQPQMSHRNSDESMSMRNATEGSKRSSRSSLVGVGAFGEMSGYDTISREEVMGQGGEVIPEALRPGGGPRRGSSWFGWGGQGSQGEERSKVE